MTKKRVFSGIQPSGNLHIGNYIGALKQWAMHQDEWENYFCVVDLHAITVPQDPKELKQKIKDNTAWYIASGIDPKKSVIFVQSHNKDHAHLAWILNCFTGMGQLSRMTQFKDKSKKQEMVSVGLFDYPVLMVADILLYDAQLVPVGNDQKQHVELARDLAQRFNAKFGDVFTVPEYMAPPAGERIMSLQHPNNKMSKSANDPMGTVNLSDEPDVIRKKIMKAVTDSGEKIEINPERPAISNLTTIFMAVTGKSEQELDEEFSGRGYKVFKESLAEAIIAELSPIQERFKEIRHSSEIDNILADGLQRAKEVSSKKIKGVEEVVGLG